MTTPISPRRLLALCRKEAFQIFRDPSSVTIAFILPVVLLFIFGFGINLDSTAIRVGLVLDDRGVEAQRFAASFFGSPYLRVVTGSRQEMTEAITAGKVRGFVVIPSDFASQLIRSTGGEGGASPPIGSATKPHPLQQLLAIEELVLQRPQHMQHQRAHQHPGRSRMHRSQQLMRLMPRIRRHPAKHGNIEPRHGVEQLRAGGFAERERAKRQTGAGTQAVGRAAD